ncbi:MAG: hypothetical protein ACLPIC_06135 [Rhodoblastus sp.]|uniref:hypothetical protein n=1 Tax=Rhodoblastus sp. TaxID=1962975 RepID=UPI003F95FE63
MKTLQSFDDKLGPATNFASAALTKLVSMGKSYSSGLIAKRRRRVHALLGPSCTKCRQLSSQGAIFSTEQPDGFRAPGQSQWTARSRSGSDKNTGRIVLPGWRSPDPETTTPSRDLPIR